MTVTIDDELAVRAQAVTPAGQEWGAFVADALRERVERAEREAARWEAARAEMQAVLHGPRRPHDPDATYQHYREQYGFRDLSHLTREELADQAEAALAVLPPEKIAEAERLGLL